MDTQDTKPKSPPVNEIRRRLTQGGLAAPVVLATLSSQKALAWGGTTNTNYKCTVSGKLSGGSQPNAKQDSCVLGRSCSEWKTATDWPKTKGDCHDSWCGDNSSYKRGVCLSQCQGYKYKAASGLCRKKDRQGNWYVCSPGTWNSVEMTCNEILHLTGTEPGCPDNFRYHQEACATVLNTYACGPSFPLDPDTCIQQFNSTRDGGTWTKDSSYTWGGGGSVTWTQGQVCDYWNCLHDNS